MSFNGRTLASQANNVGSIPITRSIASKVLIEKTRHRTSCPAVSMLAKSALVRLTPLMVNKSVML